MLYGVARISTGKQSIERQVRNILEKYPNAKMIQETYTGTKLEGRKEFENLLKILQKGDTIVFDEVSRMSRNSEEGCALYEDLFYKGVNLIFLKEPHINTEVYKKSLETQIKIKLDTGNKATDKLMNSIIDALNKFTIDLAKEQMRIAFDKAQAEVDRLHQRTKEGIITAKLNGKQIGRVKGITIESKKSKAAKEIILKHSIDFDGSLDNNECIKLAGISRNSFFKYKRELKDSIF